MRNLLVVILLQILIPKISTSQTDSSYFQTNKIIVIPGKEYKANGLHTIFFGKHWRDLWTTPFYAEELDLNKFAGGLTPVKKGGGLETKSLRLKGNDGNEYKFRSINKDPTRHLPPELQNSFYAGILQDQVSIGTPVSPLVVYPLMKETGILCVEPKIFVIPDNDKLGEFRHDFGGVPGILELNPRAGKKAINNFADADKIVNGFDIFKQIEKDNDEQVDQAEFLKARLMDIFIGDRDRHTDQWQWAGYMQGDKRIWKPIPRDRDYAFAKYDGVFPWFSGLLTHSLVGFNEDFPSILELTWSGRFLDRRFLNALEKHTWDSVASFLTEKLSDEVIRNAVKQMPPEMYKKEGENLFRMLQSRRQKLNQAAEDFYKLLADVVDVYGSNKKETAEIEELNKKELELRIYRKEKKVDKNNLIYRRKFSTDFTKEIRLHLLGGSDVAMINGFKNNNILLRIISGEGKDILVNNSDLNIKLYDSERNTIINSTKSIYYNNDKVIIPKNKPDKYEPKIEDRYGFWAFSPVADYNSDDGLIIGGGTKFCKIRIPC